MSDLYRQRILDQCHHEVGTRLGGERLEKEGWRNKNLDIVQEIYPLYQKSRATLTWVRGHEGDEGNELADTWANKAREGE